MILPTTAGYLHSMNCFSPVIYMLQTNMQNFWLTLEC